MKRILLPLLTCGFILTTVAHSFAQVATCQNATLQLNASGIASLPDALSFTPQLDVSISPSNGAPEGNNFWQSFTPSYSGILHSVTINVEQINAATGILLSIYAGQGTGGALLHSQPVAAFVVGDNVFSIGTTLDLVGGNLYTFRISSAAGTFYPQRNNANIYAGGISSIGAGTDLVSSTRMLRRPSIDNGSTAAVGIASFTLSANTFNCSNLGNVPVTLTVTDKNGATAQCIATVTILDNILPTALCVGTPLLTVALDAAGDGTLALASVDNGSGDNCSFSTSLSQSIFNCSDVGLHTITLTVTDAALNTATCDVQVEVVDNVLPQALCQNHTVQLDANGLASIVVGDIDAGSNDACGIASMVLDITNFDCSTIGANTVTLTVTDVNNGISNCSATVTVVDNILPQITCPASVVLCATAPTGAVVAYNLPTGSDNCNFTIAQTDATGLNSGSEFPLGTTTLQYTITDDGGNTDVCSFNITVDALPVANFTYTPACVGDAMFFASTSTIAGGYNIVSWTWDMGDGSTPIGQVNPIYQFPTAGDYDVTLTVVSANGCTASITQTVAVTPSPVANFSIAPVCLGATSSFVNATTIDPIYTGVLSYSWNFGDGSPVSTDANPTHTFATSGTFTVTLSVVSDDGCTDVLQQFALVSALPQAQFVSGTACEGNATQFTDLSFGTTLTHAWNFGDGNTATLQNPAHTYSASGPFTATLVVTAPGGCQSTISKIVNVIAAPVVGFSFTPQCAGTAIAFTNNADPGTYGWDFNDNSSSILANPSHVFAVEGFYDVTLTVLSAQSCSASLTQSVEVYRNPVFTLNPTDALCFNENTGSINILSVLPSTLPWQVSLNGAPSVTNQDNFLGLAAGVYTIAIVDANGCVGQGQTTVSQPNAALALGTPVLTALLCNGDNTGSLNIAASGGTAPYTYAINGGTPQTTGLFNGLAANAYFIEAIDANGCDISSNFFTITQPSVLTLNLVSFANLTCNGDNSGSITVVAGGGTAPYLYSINGGFFGQSPTFSGLTAGAKTILVRDANGCQQTLNIIISQPGLLMLSVVNSSAALCNGQATGAVTVAAASGTGPYQFSKDGVNFQGNGVFQGLVAGTYTFTVIDANGCSGTVTHVVSQPSTVAMTTTSTPVLCFGQNTGTASITASGGILPYAYSFNGGTSFIAQNAVSGLPAGNFIALVRDANGCTASQGIQITEAASALVLAGATTPVGCVNGANGTVQLSSSGGTPTYAYSNNGIVFQSSGLYTGLAAGNYTFYAQDVNSCQTIVEVTITEPLTAVAIANAVGTNPGCGLALNGSIDVDAMGGTPGYTYSSNGVTFQSSALLFGLGVGTYNVVVKDANGCTATQPVTLSAPPALILNVLTVVGVECAGTFTGSMVFSGDGGTPGYSFSLSGGAPQTSGTFTELTNGVYNVMVTDANGCNLVTPVEVTALYPLPAVDFNWVVSGEAVWFENLSQFGDTYFWDFGDGTSSTEQSPVHIYAVPGYYSVTLSVTNGCGTRTRNRPVNTIIIGIADDVQSVFSIYPNPASDVVFVTSANDVLGNVIISLTTMSGQRVMEAAHNGIMANGRLTLDVSSIGQGIYLLTVQTSEDRSVMRFNVIR